MIGGVDGQLEHFCRQQGREPHGAGRCGVQQGVTTLIAVLHNFKCGRIVQRQLGIFRDGKTARGVEIYGAKPIGVTACHIFCPNAGEDIHFLALLPRQGQHGLQGFGNAVHLKIGICKVGNGGPVRRVGSGVPRPKTAQAFARKHFILRKKRIANAIRGKHGVERSHSSHQLEHIEKISLEHIGQNGIGAGKLHIFRHITHKTGQQRLTPGHALLRHNDVDAVRRHGKLRRLGNGPASRLKHVFLHAFL